MTRIRQMTYMAAIREAIIQCMNKYPNVFIIGEGVPDPKGIFGSTLGLKKLFGNTRVFDMPVSENAITGVCLGAALCGARPIMTHQRVDFSLLAFDQIVNNIAKWFYMFGGQITVPLVIRMIVGRGWGQGAQHSQSLQALYGHIPGLKVVMPTTPYDVKGMLIAAVTDNNPVIFIEHRWLYNLKGQVPESFYSVKLDTAKIMCLGQDITVVATSYLALECRRVVKLLRKENISIELIDLRSIKPLDENLIIKSVKKTGKLLVADTGYQTLGLSSEIIARISRKAMQNLKRPPDMISLPDLPAPTSFMTALDYYPSLADIGLKILSLCGVDKKRALRIISAKFWQKKIPGDVPDPSFGPF